MDVVYPTKSRFCKSFLLFLNIFEILFNVLFFNTICFIDYYTNHMFGYLKH